MIRDIFAIIGVAITMLLFMYALRELTEKVVNCIIKSWHEHKWELYDWELYDCDCTYDYGYAPESSYIELRCKKCGEIKHIKCDIDTTRWDIEYTEKRDN